MVMAITVLSILNVIEATGHAMEVLHVIERKVGA